MGLAGDVVELCRLCDGEGGTIGEEFEPVLDIEEEEPVQYNNNFR